MPRIKQRLLLYWLIHLLFAVAFTVALLISSRPGLSEETALAYLAPLPPAIALACMHQDMDIDFIRTVFPVTAIVTTILLALFLISAVLALKSRRLTENR
jgi:lipopolysaccharide export LptBFGC system permease protein LptF